jgi:uncharacterized membrane protein
MWWIYLIIGILVAAGLGIGIYFAVSKKSSTSPVITTPPVSNVAVTLNIIIGQIQLKNN